MIDSRPRRLLRAIVVLTLLVGGAACGRPVAGSAEPAQFPAGAIEFRPVVQQFPVGSVVPTSVPGTEVLQGRAGTETAGTYVVGAPVLDGGAVAEAEPAQSEGSTNWVVRVTLTPQGRDTFGAFSTENTNSSVAIVVNGEVISAPLITGPIYGGLDISGTFTRDDVERLAAGIRGDR